PSRALRGVRHAPKNGGRLAPCPSAVKLAPMTGFSPLAALAALSLLAPAPADAALSRAEQRMIGIVDAEQSRNLSMLESWVNQNSGSLNLPGVTRVGEMVRAEHEPLGFAVEWIDMRATGRARPLVARHKGK